MRFWRKVSSKIYFKQLFEVRKPFCVRSFAVSRGFDRSKDSINQVVTVINQNSVDEYDNFVNVQWTASQYSILFECITKAQKHDFSSSRHAFALKLATAQAKQELKNPPDGHFEAMEACNNAAISHWQGKNV